MTRLPTIHPTLLFLKIRYATSSYDKETNSVRQSYCSNKKVWRIRMTVVRLYCNSYDCRLNSCGSCTNLSLQTAAISYCPCASRTTVHCAASAICLLVACDCGCEKIKLTSDSNMHGLSSQHHGL